MQNHIDFSGYILLDIKGSWNRFLVVYHVKQEQIILASV